MRNGTLPIAALLLACALVAPGCVRWGPRREKVRVGVFVSLTGSTADYGLSTINGIRMATEEVNSAGGIDGRQIELLVEDTKSDDYETSVAVRRLVHERGVRALLGEVVSSRSIVGASVAQSAGVPMLTPSSTSPAVTGRGDFIFRSCYTDPFQASALARFAADGLHARRAALLVDSAQEYSTELARLIRGEFESRGGRVVAEQTYAEGDEDFTQQLMTAGAARPDVLFVPGYYREAGLIAKRARELGLDAPLVGGDGWDSQGLYQIGGEDLRGSFFSNHFSVNDPDPAVRTFVEDYIGLHGYPPDAFAATAYDAARIMFAAVRNAGSLDRRRIRDALADTINYKGVTGTITFDRDRNAVKPIVIIRIEQGGLYAVQERIQPQPRSVPTTTPAATPSRPTP
jgi:branched-chain amino acid transport system substrate-binding protein